MRPIPKGFLGARPMKKLGFAFTDIVTGRAVYYYLDRLGREWLAEHGWAWFRVPRAK